MIFTKDKRGFYNPSAAMWDITRAFTRLNARQGEIERISGYIDSDRQVVEATLFGSGAPFIQFQQSIGAFPPSGY